MRNLFFIIFILISVTAQSQNSFKAEIRDSITGEKLTGINGIVKGTTIGNISDANGILEISNVPDGTHTIVISFLGYKDREMILNFPLPNADYIEKIKLWQESTTLEEVTVTATRTHSRIDDLPTKVEVLGAEDMVEETGVKPSNIMSLLSDNSGIQTVQTSVASGNVTIKMQGLDGKYTQILRDGQPLYDGFSGGFSVLQIPPLDLKQIEIIKGSVSTLYGGGAIGGIINLVSKEPGKKPETQVVLNQTNRGETTGNVFYSGREGKTGITIFAGNTYQKAVDVNADGFSDIPQFNYMLFHPRLFFYITDKTTLKAGYSGTFENRMGGDMQVINIKPDAAHSYFEKNDSKRNSFETEFTHVTSTGNLFTLKGTMSIFDRNMNQNGDILNATQTSGYSEISFLILNEKHNTVVGGNFLYNSFVKRNIDSFQINNFSNNTVGVFAQDDWKLTDKLTFESGLRTDYHNRYGLFVLPRLSLLYKIMPDFSLRVNAGMGYVTPSVFADQSLIQSFRYLTTIPSIVDPEKSEGINFDIHYKKKFSNEISLMMNQSFFYSRVNNPIITTRDSTTKFIYFKNAGYFIDTKGSDTYVRLLLYDLELYLGYTFTIAQSYSNNKAEQLPLTPKSKISYIVAYDYQESWRCGIESSYQSFQYLDSRQKVRGYWFYALLIEKKFKNTSIILNCENVFDFRQTKVESIYAGTMNNPIFRQIWAPLDGRIINLAVRMRF